MTRFIVLLSENGSNDKNIRLWCKDLQNGFDNLELWNGWIENTVENVKLVEMKKGIYYILAFNVDLNFYLFNIKLQPGYALTNQGKSLSETG